MVDLLILLTIGLVVVAVAQRRPHRSGTELRVALLEVLAATIRRGLPLAPVVAWTAQEERGRRRTDLRRLSEHLEDGTSLSRSLELSNTMRLPLHAVGTIRLAEGSPALPGVLEATAASLRTAGAQIARLRVVLAYPLIILAISAFVSTGILPKFREVFDSMEVDLPAMTRFAIDASEWFSEHVWLLLFVFVGLPVVGRLVPRLFKSWRGGFQPVPQYLPFLRTSARLAAAAAALRAIAADLSAGGRFDEALSLGAAAAGSGPLSASLTKAAERAYEGEPPAAVWEATGLPPLVRARAAAGFNGASAVVATRLNRLAEQCARDARRAGDRLRRLAVPLVSLLVGVIVGVQMVAVFQAITQIQGLVSPW